MQTRSTSLSIRFSDGLAAVVVPARQVGVHRRIGPFRFQGPSDLCYVIPSRNSQVTLWLSNMITRLIRGFQSAMAVVRLGSPRKPGEGLRLGTVRRPPRGVPKREFAKWDFYEVWLTNLAPSQGSVMLARRSGGTWVASIRATVSG